MRNIWEITEHLIRIGQAIVYHSSFCDSWNRVNSSSAVNNHHARSLSERAKADTTFFLVPNYHMCLVLRFRLFGCHLEWWIGCLLNFPNQQQEYTYTTICINCEIEKHLIIVSARTMWSEQKQKWAEWVVVWEKKFTLDQELNQDSVLDMSFVFRKRGALVIHFIHLSFLIRNE